MYNISELLGVLFEDNSSHFQKKLVDLGNNRFMNTNMTKNRYRGKTSINADQIYELADNLFMVQSSNDSGTFYSVDMR